MRAYLYLFIKSKKNYFFEKFKFLNGTKLSKWYLSIFFIKNIFINIMLYMLLIKFPFFRPLLVLIPLIISFSKILALDVKRWGHFYRNDWLQSYPDDGHRFFKILFANLFIDFFIEDNLLLFILVQLQFINIYLLIIVYFIIISCYIIVTSFHLVLMQSNVWLKKIYSFINYVLSSISTAFVFYVVISTVVSLITFISTKQNIVFNFIQILQHRTIIIQQFLHSRGILILASLFIVLLLNILFIYSCLIKNYFQNGKQGINAKFSDLLTMKWYSSLFSLIYPESKEHMTKELALIVELYSFNFREYFNTFFVDRSIFMLTGIFIFINSFNLANAQYIIALLIVLFYYIDISSGVNVKLISNMSFISDYYTIQIYNTMNKNIQELVKRKIEFFRVIRIPSFVSYIILSICCSFVFKFSVLTFVIVILLLSFFWKVLPYVMITNNLIYVRPNYEKFSKYIEDNVVIAREMKDFFVIELCYRIFVISVIAGIILSLIFNDIFHMYLIINSVILFDISILYVIMSRVRKNICTSLEMGDYSVDISRIFKK